MTPRTILLDCVLIGACSLLLRSEWVLHPTKPLGGDEVEYHQLAQRLARGQGFVDAQGSPTAWRTPGLPVVLAVVYRTAGDRPEAGRQALAVVTSLTAPTVYGLCLLLVGHRVGAWLAGLAWAWLPTSRRLAGLLLGEPLSALLVVCVLLLIVLAERRSAEPTRALGMAAAAGVLLGSLLLVRSFLIAVALGAVAWLLSRRAGRLAGACLVAMALTVSPWIARNLVRIGAPTLSLQTEHLWLGNHAWAAGSWWGAWGPQEAYLRAKHPAFEQLGERDRSRLFVQEAIHEVTTHPGKTLGLLPKKALIFFSPSSYLGFDWLSLGLLPLAGWGLMRLASSRESRHLLWLLGVPILGALAVSLLTFGDPRFRHPVDPLLVTLAWVGLTRRWPLRNPGGAPA